MDRTLQVIWVLLTTLGITISGLQIKSIINNNSTISPLSVPESPLKVHYDGSFNYGIHLISYDIVSYTKEEEANDVFLTYFPKAVVSSPLNRNAINSIGYYGYYAWYEGSSVIHFIAKSKSTNQVIKITIPTNTIVNTRTLPNVEIIVISFLEKMNEVKFEDFR